MDLGRVTWFIIIMVGGSAIINTIVTLLWLIKSKKEAKMKKTNRLRQMSGNPPQWEQKAGSPVGLQPLGGSQKLRNFIYVKSFKYDEKRKFKLSSGGRSKFYFNCKPVLLSSYGQYLIGKIIFNIIKDMDIQAVGGLELGAVPIACAVANESFRQGKPIEAFVVRKKLKDHGIVAKIEGNIKAGDRVIVVDDVVTTGQSTIQAIEAARENGLIVDGVVVLVDREEMNGRQNIQKHVNNFITLFNASDFLNMVGCHQPN